MEVGDKLQASTGIRPLIKSSFEYFCRHALAPRGLSPARHHLVLIHALEKLAKGIEDEKFGFYDRIMIHMPPGYAKTEYTSILFPVWFLALDPTRNIIGASNTADLAGRNGRKVRNLVSEHQDALNYTLSQDSQAAGQWETSKGGEYYATGVTGTAVGRRADLCIIDDPFRGRAEVEQSGNRQAVVDWYKGTIIGRMKPGGKIVLMHTRWHEEDLAGVLLAEADKGGDKWLVLSLPAIAGDDDPMGRAPGEPLWPEWEDLKALERKKVAVGNREWASQYQQSPAPPEGALFPTDRLRIMKSLPSPIEHLVRSWDLAATEGSGGTNPDWTVGTLIAALEDGQFAILDVRRIQGSPREVEDLILRTAKSDGDDVRISIPQDPAQAGKFQAQYLIGRLAGYMVKATPMTGSKITRAGPMVSQVEAGNLILLERGWTEDLVAEMRTFPAGAKDDQVDAAALGFMHLVEMLGSDGILKYYDSMVKNSARFSDRPPGENIQTIDTSAVDVYNNEYDRLLGTRDVMCGRCNLPVGNTRVEDGVNVWHPSCYH